VTELKVGLPAKRRDPPPSTVASHHLNATSIGSAAANRIRGRGAIGRVHSIFSGAIDVALRDGSMISIVREEVGSGPINVLTDLPRERSMAELGVKTKAEVLRKDHEIQIGSKGAVLVSLQHARLYRTEKNFPTKPRSIPEIRANVAAVARTAARRGHNQGLGGLIPLLVPTVMEKTKRPAELNSFSRLALPRVRSLLSKIGEGRISELGADVQNLAGLGPGLTPSGDDMLSGLMASLVVIAHNLKEDVARVRRVNREIALSARKRTTMLSEEYLSQAARGETNEHFQELIKKVLTESPNEARRSAELVLKVGETSGTDTVLGILLGFQLSLDEKSAMGVA
jgi:hypothetical protein